ncbi:MAG: rRNA pseudouridine synthase [Paludibacteraceae bacterium]|nr:rRNA pseudouridine synthase [Paludibacteraceae bacterium]
MYDNNRSNDNRRPAFRPDANPGEYANTEHRAPRQRTRIVRSSSVYGQSSAYNQSEGHYSRATSEGTAYPRQRTNAQGGTGYGSRRQPSGEGGYGHRAPQRNSRPAQPKRHSSVYSQRKQIEYHERYEDPTKPIRLNKYLANAGFCSRREADDFIQAGVVTVNGEVVDSLGAKVLPTDKVMFHHQPVRRERKVYILLNKPKNTVTTTDDPEERRTVMDIVKNACSERIYPVGRLDRNTTGVLLLTNDGDLAAKLTHPKFGKKKIYSVVLDRDLSEEDEITIRHGIRLDDEDIIPDALEFTDKDRKHIGLEIHSGQNRVVRRIFEKVGYKVVTLDRVSFAGLTKRNVPRGRYRFLTEREVAMLQMGAFE